MISFQPTEEQELVRTTAREFAANVMRDAARDADEEATLPGGFLDAAWALGLTMAQIPEENGGAGMMRSPLLGAIALEELAYGDAALAMAAMAPSAFAFAIVDHGTEDQKSRYLPLFCEEKFHAASMALIEPGPFFDPLSLTTTASERDGVWVLEGEKAFVPLADSASHFLVIARRGERNGGGVGELEGFIIERDAAGLEISEPVAHLGLRALPMATLKLSGVKVDPKDRLGGDKGADIRAILDSARVGTAAVQVGLAKSVLDYACPYATEREAFGEPIGRKQAVAFMLSEMAVEVDSMRWMVWKAASELEHGHDATRQAHLTRRYVNEQTMKVADDGLQVFGGHGFIREHPLELWYRHARTLGVFEGAATV
ncbi:MAG: acyl-CoA dehydrogenase family protein [bacterium]